MQISLEIKGLHAPQRCRQWQALRKIDHTTTKNTFIHETQISIKFRTIGRTRQSRSPRFALFENTSREPLKVVNFAWNMPTVYLSICLQRNRENPTTVTKSDPKKPQPNTKPRKGYNSITPAFPRSCQLWKTDTSLAQTESLQQAWHTTRGAVTTQDVATPSRT